MTVRKILPLVIFAALTGLIIFWLVKKDDVSNYLSQTIKEQAGSDVTKSVSAYADSLYNYSKNGLNFEITFLEFGAKGCRNCRRMESVMKNIQGKYPDQVNVVFLNILKPENQDQMKYFGVVAIPTQILLDRTGMEFFRNIGYYSMENLEKEMSLSIRK